MGPILAMLLATGVQAPVAEVVDLEIGTVLEVEQRADETRVFRIELEAGRAYLLEVGQRELDVIVEITAPDGTSRSFDAPLLRLEPERLLVEPVASGPNVISLRSKEYKGGTSRVPIGMLEIPVASGAERRAREALVLETLAAENNHAGGRERWTESLNAYQRASSAWRELGNTQADARAHIAMCRLLHSRMSDWQEAVRVAALAERHYESVGDAGGLASALHMQGASLIEVASFDEALERLDAARQIRQVLEDPYQSALITKHIGVVHYSRSEWSLARSHFEDSARALRALQEWAEEILAVASLAAIDYSQGKLTDAISSYEQVLDLTRPGEMVELRAGLLENLGAAYRALGKVDKALAAYTSALELNEIRDSLIWRGRSLSGIGVTYFGIGEWELARQYLERALPLRREAQHRAGQVSTLLFLGAVYLQQGDVAAATKAHMEAVELADSPRERARALVLLGRDLAASGRSDEALDVLAAAAQSALDAGTPVVTADALLERGKVLNVRGQWQDATDELQEALAAYRELGWLMGEAQALHELAVALRLRGDLAEAAEFASASIQTTEQLRSLIVNPELRASFLANQRQPYSLHVSIAMELASDMRQDSHTRDAWLARALTTSERSRTRAMLDMLQETVSGAIPAADSELAGRRRMLYEELAGLRFRQGRLLERQRDPDSLAATRHALDRVESMLNVVESEIRAANPRLAAYATPETLDVRAMQAQLEDNTALLQFELGERQSWLFVVDAESITAHELPARRDLESLAMRAHQAISVRDPEQAIRRERDALLEQLSRLLLHGAMPLKPRLVLSVDGALHYVPFAALPLYDDGRQHRPLIADHELVSVPSLSVLATQRRLLASRAPAPAAIVIFADPVFQDDDPRMSDEVPSGVVAPQDTRASPDAMWSETQLARLPATALEAEAISELVPEHQRFIATGFNASRSVVLTSELARYRFLHFATHVLIDDRYPALSALALSRYDASRVPVQGMLRLHDLYGLELNADLVTLSACETALGRELRGEGLIGFTRAFLHAGSRSVVASLWRVPDRATAELMRDFYERQFRLGLSPPAALREAQLRMKDAGRWRDPFHWGAYVSFGEWRTEPNEQGEIPAATAALREE